MNIVHRNLTPWQGDVSAGLWPNFHVGHIKFNDSAAEKVKKLKAEKVNRIFGDQNPYCEGKYAQSSLLKPSVFLNRYAGPSLSAIIMNLQGLKQDIFVLGSLARPVHNCRRNAIQRIPSGIYHKTYWFSHTRRHQAFLNYGMLHAHMAYTNFNVNKF